jgi:hypothetical protein
VEKHPPRFSFSAFFHIAVSTHSRGARLHDVPSALAVRFPRFFGAAARRGWPDLMQNKFFFKKKRKSTCIFCTALLK